ncbi:4-hydroxybenzoate polyprenyltransferase, mitochondrial [Plutella xylostella]|uniref:4-hydroxybenzoate polyprenyltransferase, mitochondrial n=1 Tax=Plutella xylostella TaxID=51655 RepID=UPI002033086A|nr:4-hydroxybenzoate polyprenyltransferase, mitochondrial [Plutella xylostella]XP_048482112.1 4-hydroxybenzoate polyprenyltransferase, mitochondrial [Plutella xylostella]
MLTRSVAGPTLLMFNIKYAARHIHSLSKAPCICQQARIRTTLLRACQQYQQLRVKPLELIRVYSTQSDHHRQKVVIDTSEPKLVLDKEDKLKTEGRLRSKPLWEHVEPYVQLSRLNKPIGIFLLYWPCSWSILLGALEAAPPAPAVAAHLATFLAGAALMRSAGCVINDLWDRDIDAQVERTKSRPLVTGAVSPRAAVALLGVQLSSALALLLTMNWFTVALCASSMVLVVSYPLAKRVTRFPQAWLGAVFSWGALAGGAALCAHVPAPCLYMYLGNVAFTTMFDTVYAFQDKSDDARIGINSTALTFGAGGKTALAALGAGAAAAWGAGGAAAGLDWPYYVALAGVGGHLAHQIYTLNPDDAADCDRKFRSNSWVGLLLFLGVLGGGWRQYRDRAYPAETPGEGSA